jgi:hypothetical protein
MNTNLLNIVKQIIATYGEGILGDPQRLKAFFNDLAKDEPKPLRIAFGRCIESGAYTALKTAPNAVERRARKTEIAQQVRDEHGLDVTLCGEALNILEAALFVGVEDKVHCLSCNKELEACWKACPYCGAEQRTTPQEKTLEPAAEQTTAAVRGISASFSYHGEIVLPHYKRKE